MTQQQMARGRNWQKARVTGWGIDSICITMEEQEIMNQISILRRTLLDNWDRQTEAFFGHPLKPHKCRSCGCRSNIPHIHPDDLHNYCLKHYKLFTDGS